MLEAMDNDIASIYEQAGIPDLRPRFVGPLLELSKQDSMTIRALATSVQVTHSAMSQTATAMRGADLVEDAPGGDARTRRIRLTERGRALLPLLEAEWQATEAAVKELDAEIPYALSKVAEDIRAALARRSFRQRLDDHMRLDARPDQGSDQGSDDSPEQ